jgi:hypothetical protein
VDLTPAERCARPQQDGEHCRPQAGDDTAESLAKIHVTKIVFN